MTSGPDPRWSAGLRAASVPPFHAMAMSKRASERVERGLPTMFLQVGQPSTGAPIGARRAVIAELEADRPLGYTNSPGLPALAERIAQHYRDTDDVPVDPNAIAIVSGHRPDSRSLFSPLSTSVIASVSSNPAIRATGTHSSPSA